jgi:hypothetical protein
MRVATPADDPNTRRPTMAKQSPELQPQLKQAQRKLKGALKEACAVNVELADTGELIHIDELLAIAGDSAKQVISVRRRMRRDAGKKDASAPSRVFEDDQQVRWTTFAVHPSSSKSDRARLPGAFQDGWLSFDSGSETRRISPIPEGWHLLSDDELRKLFQRAIIAPRRTPPDRKTT